MGAARVGCPTGLASRADGVAALPVPRTTQLRMGMGGRSPHGKGATREESVMVSRRTSQPCPAPSCEGERLPITSEEAAAAGFGISRRAAMLSAGGFVLAAGPGSQTAQAETPKELFCGITQGTVPSWAYRTDFGQFFLETGSTQTYVRTVGSPPSKPLLPFLAGAPPKAPLLVLHGGPGLSTVYMESLELLAAEGREIIFYDQVGCGLTKSGGADVAPVSMGSCLEQFDAVRRELNLEAGAHLLGHGWGAMLALAACTRPGGCEGIVSLSLVSAAPSMSLLVDDRLAALGRLPETDRSDILDLDSKGQAAVWDAGMRPYSLESVNRVPRGCLTSSGASASAAVYESLHGSRYFSESGSMARWDVTNRLSEITVPTLVVRGEFDETSQRTANVLLKGIPGAAALECLGAGSCCHLDNPETFLKEVNDHMDAADDSAAPEK